MSKVGIDFDDVSVKFVDELVTFANAVQRTTFTLDDVTNYNLHALFDSEENKDEIIGMFYESFVFASIPFTPGFKSTYNDLKNRHDIYFITSRYGSAIPVTQELFKREGLPLDKLIFSREKGKEAHRLGLDYFVDDAIHNLDHIAVHSSTVPVVFDRPWNVQAPYRRVYNWKDIANLLDSQSLKILGGDK